MPCYATDLLETCLSCNIVRLSRPISYICKLKDIEQHHCYVKQTWHLPSIIHKFYAVLLNFSFTFCYFTSFLNSILILKWLTIPVYSGLNNWCCIKHFLYQCQRMSWMFRRQCSSTETYYHLHYGIICAVLFELV